MILRLEDLIEYSKDLARLSGYPLPISDDPVWSGYDNCSFNIPGISDNEFDALVKAFPTLPESYLNFIKMYDVKQIELGGYQISVCSQKSKNFADEMISWNNPYEIRFPISKKHDLVYFGSDGFDEFFVAGTKSDYKEGEILSIDHERYDEDPIPIKRVAPNYETFLTICANKYQLELNGALSVAIYRDELTQRLDALKLPREYYDYWVW